MIMPSVGRSEHLDLFEKGIARKLDFSFAGPQSLRISQLIEDGLLEIGAIHTYIELYSRLVVDLIQMWCSQRALWQTVKAISIQAQVPKILQHLLNLLLLVTVS